MVSINLLCFLQAVAVNQTLQRKKSLPDVQVLPKSVTPMSREEASVLSSARREEVRKQREESERLRANPLLYFLSPHFKVILKLTTRSKMSLKLNSHFFFLELSCYF